VIDSQATMCDILLLFLVW